MNKPNAARQSLKSKSLTRAFSEFFKNLVHQPAVGHILHQTGC